MTEVEKAPSLAVVSPQQEQKSSSFHGQVCWQSIPKENCGNKHFGIYLCLTRMMKTEDRMSGFPEKHHEIVTFKNY